MLMKIRLGTRQSQRAFRAFVATKEICPSIVGVWVR